MSKQIFNLQENVNVLVQANETIFNRFKKNLDPHSYNLKKNKGYDSKIINTLIGELINEDIKKLKGYPYLEIKKEKDPNLSFSYFRYNTLVRKINREEHKEYNINTFFKDDEEGILLCIKNFLYHSYLNKEKIPIHGSLININDKGILLFGHGKSGKTSLLIELLLQFGGSFISDERVFISKEGNTLRGEYVPDVVKVRFNSIKNSPLRSVLNDAYSFDSTQYIDIEALKQIITTRSYHVDAGLTLSRQKFLKLIDVNSLPRSRIDKIIFLEYSPREMKLNDISRRDISIRLEKCKKINDEIQSMGDNYYENHFKIAEEVIPKDIELLKLKFSSIIQLKKYKLLEELIR